MIHGGTKSETNTKVHVRKAEAWNVCQFIFTVVNIYILNFHQRITKAALYWDSLKKTKGKQTWGTLWLSQQLPATLRTQSPHRIAWPLVGPVVHPGTPGAAHCRDLHHLLHEQTSNVSVYCRISHLHYRKVTKCKLHSSPSWASVNVYGLWSCFRFVPSMFFLRQHSDLTHTPRTYGTFQIQDIY